MAGSSPVVQHHCRSLSLPSRLPANSPQSEAKVHKLNTLESSLLSPVVPLEAETLQMGLAGLAGLYSCFDELFHFSLLKQSLSCNRNGKLVEGALDISVGLLDMCGTVRDLFAMTKENVEDLQSFFRRKGVDSSMDCNVNVYISFRKKVKRDAAKCLRTLKQMDNKIGSFPRLDVDNHPSVAIWVLSEVSSSTISILRSLLLYLSLPATKTKARGWSLVSRFVQPGSLASKGGRESIESINEVVSVDFALSSLNKHCHCQSSNIIVDLQMTQKKLQTLDIRIQNIEAGLITLYRHLIQHRVSLLNILTL